MGREKIRIEVVTPPVEPPVTVQELKAELVIPDDDIDEEALMMSYLRTATERAERYMNRSIMTQSLSLYMDRWPGTRGGWNDPWWDGVRDGAISELPAGRRYLELPRSPVQSVTQILIYADDDTADVYSSAKYLFDSVSIPPRIVLRDGAETPAPTRVALGIQIDYVAGYGDYPHQVPESIRKGILIMAAFLHRHRGECPPEVADVQSGASNMWRQYRIRRM